MPGGGLTAQQQRLLRALVAAVVVSAVAVAGIHAGALTGFRRAAQDALHPRGAVDPRVVVVGIDAEALRAVGSPWPWPRPVHARLVRAITAAGASAIAVDVLFAEQAAGDAELAAAIAEAGNVVLASVPSGLTAGCNDLRRAVTLAESLPSLAPAAVGHAVVTEDVHDGVVRRVPAVIEGPDAAFIPSLALALAAAPGGAPVPIVRPAGVQLGAFAVPTGPGHEMVVSYGAAPRVVSAAALLDGRVGPGALAGRLVLVGVTDPTLGDRHRTPVSKAAGDPGVVVQAQAASTILQADHLRSGGDGETTVAVFVAALLVLLATQLLRLRAAVALTGAVVVAYTLVVSARFDAGTVMDPVLPPLVALLALVVGVGLRYGTETRQRQRIASLFGQYVPAAVAEQLLGDERGVAELLQGRRVRVAVFFCDLRGFTSVAATLAPPDVRRILDLYYLHVTAEILERGGSVMQFVGDEVFAVFGAPLPMEHAERTALECAVAVQARERLLHDDLVAVGLPTIRYGISLHAGDVVAAHVGTERRRQYAVVGDTVNVGSRLCGVADAGSIVVSAEVEQWCRPLSGFETAGTVDLKGVVAPVPVWVQGEARVPIATT